jgi:hypothetical protein
MGSGRIGIGDKTRVAAVRDRERSDNPVDGSV